MQMMVLVCGSVVLPLAVDRAGSERLRVGELSPGEEDEWPRWEAMARRLLSRFSSVGDGWWVLETEGAPAEELHRVQLEGRDVWVRCRVRTEVEVVSGGSLTAAEESLVRCKCAPSGEMVCRAVVARDLFELALSLNGVGRWVLLAGFRRPTRR